MEGTTVGDTLVGVADVGAAEGKADGTCARHVRQGEQMSGHRTNVGTMVGDAVVGDVVLGDVEGSLEGTCTDVKPSHITRQTPHHTTTKQRNNETTTLRNYYATTTKLPNYQTKEKN